LRRLSGSTSSDSAAGAAAWLLPTACSCCCCRCAACRAPCCSACCCWCLITPAPGFLWSAGSVSASSSESMGALKRPDLPRASAPAAAPLAAAPPAAAAACLGACGRVASPVAAAALAAARASAAAAAAANGPEETCCACSLGNPLAMRSATGVSAGCGAAGAAAGADVSWWSSSGLLAVVVLGWSSFASSLDSSGSGMLVALLDSATAACTNRTQRHSGSST